MAKIFSRLVNLKSSRNKSIVQNNTVFCLARSLQQNLSKGQQA